MILPKYFSAGKTSATAQFDCVVIVFLVAACLSVRMYERVWREKIDW